VKMLEINEVGSVVARYLWRVGFE